MFTVYDANGKEHYHHHAVDVKEAVATGRFFNRNPVKPYVEPVVEPITPVPGQDIEPIEQDVAPVEKEVEPIVPVEEIETESGKKRKARQA